MISGTQFDGSRVQVPSNCYVNSSTILTHQFATSGTASTESGMSLIQLWHDYRQGVSPSV